jgi:glycosyltransferase involved in cell wall biosynthesis
MTEPLVSVKMITYNHAPFITQAIEGVLKQKTNFPFELVIGEDCSTDGTRDIVVEYKKKYADIIQVLTSDKNVGAKKNSYRALKACRGKYIAFCEGDDYWQHPFKLQKQIDYMENNPECGLVYSSYDMYYVKSKKRIKNYVKYRNWEMLENPDMSAILEGKGGMASLGILTCTVMVRRDICQQVIESDPYLHQSDHFTRGDTQLWAEIANLAYVHYIPESLATYNQTEESATRSKDNTKILRHQINGAEIVLYLCDKYNLLLSTRNEAEKTLYNGMLRLAFHTRSAELADEVRKKKKVFTFREWLLYYGTKNSTFYYPFRLAALFRNFFLKAYHQWL